MSLTELHQVVRQAEAREDQAIVAEVAQRLGVGVRDLQSRNRSADLARRRAVLAWVLHDRLRWTQRRIGAALARTTRQIKRMVRNQRVVSPFEGT